PRGISANRQCLPKKESRSRSGRCVHRATSNRTYYRPDKREGQKKTRAKALSTFWAAGNRRSGVFAGSRFNSLRRPEETQRPCHRILSMLILTGYHQDESQLSLRL